MSLSQFRSNSRAAEGHSCRPTNGPGGAGALDWETPQRSTPAGQRRWLLRLLFLVMGFSMPALCQGWDTNAPSTGKSVQASQPGVAAPVKPTSLATSNAVGNAAPSALSQALTEANMSFATTSLMRSDEEQSQAKIRETFVSAMERKLEAGRHLRAAKLFDEAVPNLTALITGEAPDELKRAAMLELALVFQEQNNLIRALQVLSQYLTCWPQDPNAPEILLRQGLIYRQLGIHSMAMSKFYATMTTALVLKNDHFDYYRKLVLQSQAEIAETLALENKHGEAAEAFARLLKEESPSLNRVRVQFRYIHSLAAQGKFAETIGQAQDFLACYTNASEQAEVRFLLASSLKKLGRNNDALQEVLRLLQSQQGLAQEHPETLAYWQQRTGNEIANQLYQEGDFVRALDIYQSLLLLNPSPVWQCPVFYQIGLAYERLEQPAKAAESYDAILAKGKELSTNAPPSLKTLIDMAGWRQGFLRWHMTAEVAHHDLKGGRIFEMPSKVLDTKTNLLKP